jgi:hypothetical protein
MIKPRTGHAFLKLEEKTQNAGNIVLPQSVRAKVGKVGRIVGLNLWEEGRLYQVWLQGRLMTLEASQWNPEYNALLGKRVYAESGRVFNWNGESLFLVRLEHIIAVLPDKALTTASTDIADVPRCKWCKSSGELNIIMTDIGDGRLRCPLCTKDESGSAFSGKRDKWDAPLPEMTQRESDLMNAIERGEV